MHTKTYVAESNYTGIDNITELRVTHKERGMNITKVFTFAGDCRGIPSERIYEIADYLTEGGRARALVLTWGGPTSYALGFKHVIRYSNVYPVDLKFTYGAYTVTNDLNLLCAITGVKNTEDVDVIFRLYNMLRDVPRELNYILNPYLVGESAQKYDGNFGGFLGALNREAFDKQTKRFKTRLEVINHRLYTDTANEEHLHVKYRNMLLHLEQRLASTQNDVKIKTREGSLITRNKMKPLVVASHEPHFFQSLKEEFGYSPFSEWADLTNVTDYELWRYYTEVTKISSANSMVKLWRTMYQEEYKEIEHEEELELALAY